MKLEDVATDKQRMKEDKAFRSRDSINQGREADPSDAVATLGNFAHQGKFGPDTETVLAVLGLSNESC